MTRFLGPVVGAALLAACQPSPRMGLSPDDVAAVRMATDRYVQAALAGDWDRWAALSTDSAVFLQPNGTPIEGRPALRRWITAFSGLDSFSSTVLEVEGQGDLAVSRGTYAFVLGPQAAGSAVDTGKFLTVWRRQPDGAWRISRNIWNSDRVAQ
jgi:ketosteroid isomerase-like protein